MKPIVLQSILGRVATKSDGSLSLNFSTPEMTAEESCVLFKLTRLNLQLTLKPLGEALEAPCEVKGELSSKTASQRLRGVLFVMYKQKQDAGFLAGKTYEQFYGEQMERMIEEIKSQLDP
jgi:hypothetical protein